MSSLGTGFVAPVKDKNRIRHFDKDTYLTLGNGDKLIKDEHLSESGMKDDDELLSEFLSILLTLVFYTDPSECNRVMVLTSNQASYAYLLCEMFPDYKFSFTETISTDHQNHKNIKSKSISKHRGDIIFVDNILKYKEEIHEWDPYLIMGVFRPKTNVEFFDGILIRPVMGVKCRLLVKGIAYRSWNKKNLCRLVNYHLRKVRHHYKFYDPVTGEEGVDYDTATYRYILSEYLVKVNLPNGDIDNVHQLVESKLG